MTTNVPDDHYYSEDDEWVSVDGETATIGITYFAQDSLSDIVYLELPDVGATFAKGETFGVVESVKSASDLIMPIDGEVVAVNEALIDAPEMINDAPYKSWMIKIAIGDSEQLDDLLSAVKYSDYRELE